MAKRHEAVFNAEGDKLCLQCGEYWPPTSEFFQYGTNGKLSSPCKACIEEHRKTVTGLKPCCVPGCTQPRYNPRRARCWDHRYEIDANGRKRFL